MCVWVIDDSLDYVVAYRPTTFYLEDTRSLILVTDDYRYYCSLVLVPFGFRRYESDVMITILNLKTSFRWVGCQQAPSGAIGKGKMIATIKFLVITSNTHLLSVLLVCQTTLDVLAILIYL